MKFKSAARLFSKTTCHKCWTGKKTSKTWNHSGVGAGLGDGEMSKLMSGLQ